MTTTHDQLVRALQAMNEALQSLLAESKPEPVVEQEQQPTLALTPIEQQTTSDAMRARRKWTQQEDYDMHVLCRYLSDAEVARLLGRTPKAIEDRRLNTTNLRRVAS